MRNFKLSFHVFILTPRPHPRQTIDALFAFAQNINYNYILCESSDGNNYLLLFVTLLYLLHLC